MDALSNSFQKNIFSIIEIFVTFLVNKAKKSKQSFTYNVS